MPAAALAGRWQWVRSCICAIPSVCQENIFLFARRGEFLSCWVSLQGISQFFQSNYICNKVICTVLLLGTALHHSPGWNYNKRDVKRTASPPWASCSSHSCLRCYVEIQHFWTSLTEMPVGFIYLLCYNFMREVSKVGKPFRLRFPSPSLATGWEGGQERIWFKQTCWALWAFPLFVPNLCLALLIPPR